MPTKTLIARKTIEGEELVCLDPEFYEQLCECLQEQPYLTEYNRCALETFKNGESDGVFEVLNEEDVSTDPSVDDVNHPAHYTSHPSGVECITLTRHMPFCIGNAWKYTWRMGLKPYEGMDDLESEIKDLKKAIWYLNDHLKLLESKRKV